MIILLQAFLSISGATSWAPPPRTLAAQLEGAEVAGAFEVRGVETVVLEDGFPTSHVTLAPARGGDEVRLILPGGVVNGEFLRGAPGSFQVRRGETLYLMLEPAVGLPGFFNVAWGFRVGVFREVDGRVEDVDGLAIVDLPCDARPVRSLEEPGMKWHDATKALASCGGGR